MVLLLLERGADIIDRSEYQVIYWLKDVLSRWQMNSNDSNYKAPHLSMLLTGKYTAHIYN
jgi:hypothetical protein